MVNCVIWDWNGTLLDDVRINFEIVNELLRSRHKNEISFESYKTLFRMPIRDFYRDAGFRFEEEPFESIAADYFKSYESRIPEMTLTSGVTDVLEYLRGRGIDQYILSATYQTDLIAQVRSKKIDGYFKQIVGNSDYSVASKIENGVKLKSTLCSGGVCFFIGDLYHDYEVARAIGAACILYANGHQTIRKSTEYTTAGSMAAVIQTVAAAL